MKFVAHSLPDNSNINDWESLATHEKEVAARCRSNLGRINPKLAPWGEILGCWHDIGKYSNAFQSYLRRAGDPSKDVHGSDVGNKVDHSTAAAQLSMQVCPSYGKLLAYIFAGHHAGLPDWDVEIGAAGLKQRLQKKIEPWQCPDSEALAKLPVPPPPQFGPIDKRESVEFQRKIASFRIQFWIRMLFSALVDADFLATESFMSPSNASLRPTSQHDIQQLAEVLENHIKKFQKSADSSPINQLRAEVSDACFNSASEKPGLFSLNVPTGGGKTLASLRFALNHAKANQMDGVIVAIPFTSIIEQNAAVYREIFSAVESDDIVLEHHSNLEIGEDKETSTNRLQTENWDARIVVTTNVQFFESLFACRTSRCRKLHRIARRVIVLDEVQTLPVELLEPTLMAIRELVETFHCTVVLCTATQPAFEWRTDFPIGLRDIKPIIQDSTSLHRHLTRTKVETLGKISDEQLVQLLEKESQVLCIVNTRPAAAAIFESIHRDQNTFHLSTRMCAAHRMSVLDHKIRPLLSDRQPCRVVSTQLIEAGVDIDFPVVYRAICGLDSLTQAAGRCNREGRLDQGQVYLFEMEAPPPPGMLRQSADSANEVMGQFEDLLAPEAVAAYFQCHYWRQNHAWDCYDVLQAMGSMPQSMNFQFRQIAERYRFIRDNTVSILVPWGKGREYAKQLENPFQPPNTIFWRSIQRYIVNVRQHEMIRLRDVGAVAQFHDCWVLTQPHLYSDSLGLNIIAADGILPVDDLIC